jgi:hypothetical protein
MKKAMRASGAKTKCETVERGVELIVRLKVQERMRALRGKLRCKGDLDSMRHDRPDQ